MTWVGSLAKASREKASEQIEASVSVLGPLIQILKSKQRTAAANLHPAVSCSPWVRDDDETEPGVRRPTIVESSFLKRCCPRNPCHRLSERVGDDTARAERLLRVLTHSRNFLLTYVSNSGHYRSLSR